MKSFYVSPLRGEPLLKIMLIALIDVGCPTPIVGDS